MASHSAGRGDDRCPTPPQLQSVTQAAASQVAAASEAQGGYDGLVLAPSMERLQLSPAAQTVRIRGLPSADRLEASQALIHVADAELLFGRGEGLAA